MIPPDRVPHGESDPAKHIEEETPGVAFDVADVCDRFRRLASEGVTADAYAATAALVRLYDSTQSSTLEAHGSYKHVKWGEDEFEDAFDCVERSDQIASLDALEPFFVPTVMLRYLEASCSVERGGVLESLLRAAASYYCYLVRWCSNDSQSEDGPETKTSIKPGNSDTKRRDATAESLFGNCFCWLECLRQQLPLVLRNTANTTADHHRISWALQTLLRPCALRNIKYASPAISIERDESIPRLILAGLPLALFRPRLSLEPFLAQIRAVAGEVCAHQAPVRSLPLQHNHDCKRDPGDERKLEDADGRRGVAPPAPTCRTGPTSGIRAAISSLCGATNGPLERPCSDLFMLNDRESSSAHPGCRCAAQHCFSPTSERPNTSLDGEHLHSRIPGDISSVCAVPWARYPALRALVESWVHGAFELAHVMDVFDDHDLARARIGTGQQLYYGASPAVETAPTVGSCMEVTRLETTVPDDDTTVAAARSEDRIGSTWPAMIYEALHLAASVSRVATRFWDNLLDIVPQSCCPRRHCSPLGCAGCGRRASVSGVDEQAAFGRASVYSNGWRTADVQSVAISPVS